MMLRSMCVLLPIAKIAPLCDMGVYTCFWIANVKAAAHFGNSAVDLSRPGVCGAQLCDHAVIATATA